jgi:CHAT domain-containing protein
METCRTVASTSCCATARRSDGWRPGLRRLAAASLWLAAAAPALAADAGGTACTTGRGPLRLLVEDLQAAHARAGNDLDRARSAAALGAAWLKLGRADEAEPLLRQAAANPLPPRDRAAALMDLGNLLLARGQAGAAAESWDRAAALQPDDAELALAVALNRLRLQPAADRVPALQALLPRVAAPAPPAARARLALNLAAQAQALVGDEPGGAAAELSWRALELGRAQALAAADDRLAAEALEGLAALYEAQQRPAEALALVEQGIAHARRADARERLMTLEGRAGRLAAAGGDAERALAAYRRAVEHVEAVRSDIPVQYQDGRSSFRDTLEPLYLGLTDQLLRRSEAAPPAERQALLRQARDTIELIKQTELADYLRDRCSVDAATRSVTAAPPAGTAIYYPIILPDRLELLLETAAGLERRSVAVGGERLRDEVQAFVAALRNGQPLRARSEALYRTLMAPLDGLLQAQRIHTLVAVPDGVLRLLPLAALHDGRGWLLQRLAVATVPGLSLTAPARGERRPLQALLAGLSEPGPVVDKLSQAVIDAVLEPGTDPQQPRATGSRGPAAPDPQRASALREALALPGVKQEIETLAGVLPGTVLLDRGFTLDALKAQMRARAHPIVHIASHGVFGHDADSTFIMTYDELLTLDGLQALLRDGRPRGATIELLTLSACQTAEGDDRAPLGMSGSALKARARSALGTLWPVSDESAKRVMGGFYRHLAEGRLSRIESLRQAQLELLQQPQRGHPYHWAPFILIGDWQ